MKCPLCQREFREEAARRAPVRFVGNDNEVAARRKRRVNDFIFAQLKFLDRRENDFAAVARQQRTKFLDGFRVLERQDASRIPFEEAQEKLRKKIKREVQEREYRAVVENLKSKTSVWTIYDAEDAQLAERQNRASQR